MDVNLVHLWFEDLSPVSVYCIADVNCLNNIIQDMDKETQHHT